MGEYRGDVGEVDLAPNEGLVGEYDGDAGEKLGELGEKAGDVGPLYSGEDGPPNLGLDSPPIIDGLCGL